MFKTRTSFLLLVTAVAGFVALALCFVLHGVLNADEGFYLAAAHLVSEGYRPYHDFGYTQGPLFPYLNLIWLEVFGHSLAGQRLAGLAWTLLTVALGIVWLKRRQSHAAAALFVLLLLGAPVWLAFAVKGKTYALAGLAVLAGTMALLARWPIWIRWAVFIVAAAVGTGVRFPMAGFFIPAFFGLLILTRSMRARCLAVLATVISATMLLMATATADWEGFLFWTTEFHRESSFYIPVWTHFVDCFRFAPLLWIFAAATTLVTYRAFLSARVKLRGDVSSASMDSSAASVRPLEAVKGELMVFVSVGVALVANLSASTTYAEYIFPLLPASAFMTAPWAAEFILRQAMIWRALAVIGIAGVGWNYLPEFSPNVLLHAGQAEAFLRANVPANSVVAASMPEIAVAAGARLPLGLAMGKFSVTEDFSEDVARERSMLTPASLLRLLRDPATQALVGSPSYNWNFFWSLPSYRVLSPPAREQIEVTLRTQYRLEFLNGEYAIYLRRAKAVH